GSFSITTGTISAAATPIDVITTVAKAQNPPDSEVDGGISVETVPGKSVGKSDNAATTVTFSEPSTAITANDTVSLTIDGQLFTTAALGADATAAEIATAFAALTEVVTSAEGAGTTTYAAGSTRGWDITSVGTSVVFTKSDNYLAETTGGGSGDTKITPITTTDLSLTFKDDESSPVTYSPALGAASFEDVDPGTVRSEIVVGESSMNLSGLNLFKGDRVTIEVNGGAKTIQGTFDTDLETTIANLAADLKLEDNTFSDVSVSGYIITYNGSSDGTTMPTMSVKVQSSTLDDVGIQKVGSKYLSNSFSGDASLALNVNNVLGIGETYDKEVQVTIGDGLESTPGVATGTKAGVDISGTFSVLSENNVNVINVTIDGIDGEVVIPPGSYTGTTFASAMQERINLIRSDEGRQIANVKVDFDLDAQSFSITSGTVGSESFVNINGSSNWGLNNTAQVRGAVPEITVIKQATDTEGNKLFIGLDGKETTVPPKVLPTWAPIYLDKGELTFNTKGKLISPKEGVIYSPYDPDNGSNLLRLSVDYGKNSTQYSAPFSVLSLSQDGYPSGRLDGLAIDSSGVVRANYTNGNQVALGKLILANFANPNGLKQVGNANYVSTATSGSPVLGQAGSDGYGTIQGGALERANVDLTEELVNLITAQRNFQANAKAIETSSTLTQTIINIRG
ncbi:MAG: flagellar hook-basal body complex protein, partial [Methylococcales bacterium]|nr:flagellar hook-basal body complex protein [Methylococcales bacterium]